jgi:hypothetical protein
MAAAVERYEHRTRDACCGPPGRLELRRGGPVSQGRRSQRAVASLAIDSTVGSAGKGRAYTTTVRFRRR